MADNEFGPLISGGFQPDFAQTRSSNICMSVLTALVSVSLMALVCFKVQSDYFTASETRFSILELAQLMYGCGCGWMDGYGCKRSTN